MASRRQVKGLPIGAVNKKNEPICGAWCHGKQDYCQAQPMDNGRCPMHGGFNSDRRPRNTKLGPANGLYSQHLNVEEANLYGQLKIGSLEQEIRLLRIQLLRALNAQEKWELQQDSIKNAMRNDDGSLRTPDEIIEALELEACEYKRQKGIDNRGQPVDQEEQKLVQRKRDFKGEARSLINLIAKLEREHHELLKTDIPDSERIAQIAHDLRAFTEAARATVPEPKKKE